MSIGERRQFLMAWIFAPDLTVHAQPQAYTRLAHRRYLFENLDGSGSRRSFPSMKKASSWTIPTCSGG